MQVDASLAVSEQSLPRKRLDSLIATDIDLINAHRNGSSLALNNLIKRYFSLVKSRARSYFIIGGDKEDLYQEGMIGLFKAARDYEDKRQVSFKIFADLCIKRQMITAIKTATRNKHMPLNSYISIHNNYGEFNNDNTFVNLLVNKNIIDPADLIVSYDEIKYISNAIKSMLSSFEREVLKLYTHDKSYESISISLDRNAKAVDNAIQRIKRKINSYMKKRSN